MHHYSYPFWITVAPGRVKSLTVSSALLAVLPSPPACLHILHWLPTSLWRRGAWCVNLSYAVRHWQVPTSSPKLSNVFTDVSSVDLFSFWWNPYILSITQISCWINRIKRSQLYCKAWENELLKAFYLFFPFLFVHLFTYKWGSHLFVSVALKYS